MKDFKAKVKAISPEIFKEINNLLKEHGLNDAEVTGIKLRHKNVEMHSCPPGKQLYCWKDVNGKEYCRCI